jgi:hypothetical protein
MAEWYLFLDDQANEPGIPMRAAPSGWTVARTSVEAVALVERQGPPQAMSLDHDLGGDDTVMRFLRWLADTATTPPSYTVHSANPVGRDNIISFMESWKRSV